MIQGGQDWQAALAQPQKQALYILEIPAFGIIITSFIETALNQPVAQSGWGNFSYGIGTWGS